MISAKISAGYSDKVSDHMRIIIYKIGFFC